MNKAEILIEIKELQHYIELLSFKLLELEIKLSKFAANK